MSNGEQSADLIERLELIKVGVTLEKDEEAIDKAIEIIKENEF